MSPSDFQGTACKLYTEAFLIIKKEIKYYYKINPIKHKSLNKPDNSRTKN